MYMIGHLTYGTLNTGDMFWTLCGQNTLLLLYDWSCPLSPLKGQLLQLLSYRTALET